ncbi:hypothetical protein M2272_005252 [Mycobacterium frederiksbergense]|uniref:DUF3040 domain-containing protein n=1 Tax=Mycolicibacterium frederiksbergense TaxID=117567 RepID=A0ABT6L6L0_9MYCO|nr:hypothetical protein [Mycolicibacterium frederiksbergense]MDH6198593.1 hypothetical protein [Mycolicibacterium frederiksbergense]
MSRRFAGVGIGIAAARLREIAAGAPAADAELTNVEFAVLASELRHDERLAAFQHARRRCLRLLMVTGMCLVMFGSLLCMTWLMLSLMLHTAPF